MISEERYNLLRESLEKGANLSPRDFEAMREFEESSQIKVEQLAISR